MTPSQYAEELVRKTFLFESVYEEYSLNKVVIIDLDSSIRHSMQYYWEGQKNTNVPDLASHTTFLLRLQRHDLASK